MKVGIAAANVAVPPAAVAAVSTTSDSPLPQPTPSQPDPAAKAPALPVSEPSTPAISMTAALKNVGAVSIHVTSYIVVLFENVLLAYIHVFNFAFGRLLH